MAVARFPLLQPFLLLSLLVLALTNTCASRELEWKPLYEPGPGGWMVSVRISPHESNRVLVGGDMLGTGLSLDGGKTWQVTFGFLSGEIADFTWHPTVPDLVWAGSMSGPHISTDGGLHWKSKRNGMPPLSNAHYSAPVEKVLFDPNNSQRLLAIGGSNRSWASPGKPAWGVIWESLDAGENWKRLTTITRGGSSEDFDAEGVNITSATFGGKSSTRLYAMASPASGNGQAVFISDDGGRNWAVFADGLPHRNGWNVRAHPTDPDIAYIALTAGPIVNGTCQPGGIYKTTNGGRKWFSISRGLDQHRANRSELTANYKGFDVAPGNPEVMFTADGSWRTGVIYTTQDGGENWYPLATKQNIGHDNKDPRRARLQTLETACPAGLAPTVISIDPNDPARVFAASSEHIVRTLDGGVTWTDSNTKVERAGTIAWRGSGYSGWCSLNICFDPYLKGRSILQAMDAAQAWISTDDLESWMPTHAPPNPWTGGQAATFTRGNTIYITLGSHDFRGIGRSTDGGITWSWLSGASHGLPELDVKGFKPTGIYALPDKPEKVWAILGDKLYASIDSGQTWSTIFESPGLNSIAADPNVPDQFYLSASNQVFVTSDGVTFKDIGGPKFAGNLVVDAWGRLLIAAHKSPRPGVWRFDPKISSWTRLIDETWTEAIAVDPADPTRIAFSTSDNPYHDQENATGVYISSDDGKTWSCQTAGLPLMRGRTLQFDPFSDRLVFGSFGRGFFETEWPKDLKIAGPRTYSSGPEDFDFANPTKVAIELRNGSMEKGNDIPEAWTEKWGASDKLILARDTNEFRDGKSSLRATFSGTGDGLVVQMHEASAGNSFRLQGAVKCRGTAKVNVGVMPFNSRFETLGFLQACYLTNDSDWKDFAATITLPSNTVRFAVVLLLQGDGTAWMDALEITSPGVAAR